MVTGTAEGTNQATGKGQEGQIPPAPTIGLDERKGGADTKSEKVYSQSEVDALLGKAGQRKQVQLTEVTAERDSLKTQLTTLTAEITEAKESIVSLTKDIEEMSKDDPDKIALVKLRKEKEAELKILKAAKAELEPVRAEITKWKRDQLVYTVADEFITGDGKAIDFDSFMTAADKLKLGDREGLETLAETMGFKPKGEVPPPATTPAPKTYSGNTDGGQGELTKEEKLKRRYPTMKV